MLTERTEGIGAAPLVAIPALVILTTGLLYSLIKLISFIETFSAHLR